MSFVMITPEEAVVISKPKRSVKYWRKQAQSNQQCEICNQPAWRFGTTGLCFTCTTGESDASSDYELIAE